MNSESWPNVEAAPEFSCERQLFLFMLNSTVLFTSNSNVLYTSNSNYSLYVELKLFLFVELKLFLFVELKLFLLRRTKSVPLNSAASLLNSVSGFFYFAYLLHEKPRQWSFHQCILREEFRYFVLCTLFKNVTVSWIKCLHYSVDSGFCITLQLWNTVGHINPVIMSCLTF